MEEWNSNPNDPPALLTLIQKAFPDKNFDGRSKEGRAGKAFLATSKIHARGSHEYHPKEKKVLTDEQKEFIDNNEIKIDFKFKNLVSPYEVLESPDSRKLGILVKNIKIVPKNMM